MSIHPDPSQTMMGAMPEISQTPFPIDSTSPAWRTFFAGAETLTHIHYDQDWEARIFTATPVSTGANNDGRPYGACTLQIDFTAALPTEVTDPDDPAYGLSFRDEVHEHLTFTEGHPSVSSALARLAAFIEVVVERSGTLAAAHEWKKTFARFIAESGEHR